MGALFSRFRWKRTSSSGAEINEEAKEELISEKDGIPVPSSPSQDTVVPVASSGGGKVQESPTKTGAPLAQQEESFTQQTSPVAEEPREETKPDGEAKTGDSEAPEPEVRELQRVNETKLEKEKTVDTSGVTTEKTVYTQVSESVRIQETKGPVVDPFATSQTVFPPFSKTWYYDSKPQAAESQSPSYVHSVKVAESSISSPSTPVSAGGEAVTPEKTQSADEAAESLPEDVVPISDKIEVSIKTVKAEVAHVPVNVPASVTDRKEDELEKPKVELPEVPSTGAEVIHEDQVVDDSERSEVEDAVVKIQAGIRGYLTRKSLKESRKDGPMMQSGKGNASVQPPSKQEEVHSEEPEVLLADEVVDIAESTVKELTDEVVDIAESTVKELADEVVDIGESTVKEVAESDAAVKIQAMYRGYRTRKQLDELLTEPTEEEIEALDISTEQTESNVPESRRSPQDRSPVTVTENFVPILKAQVTITPPSSPTIKKESNLTISPSVEVAPEVSQTSALPEKSDDDEGTADTGMPEDDEDDGSKEQAATKIQAAFRGYKVRKTSRKEASRGVKDISKDIEENIHVEGSLDSHVEVPQNSSPDVPRDSPSPPPELENDDEDTLEDDAEDEAAEVSDVQWQTSELYADNLGPKPSHEHEESKTESSTEEATALVSDSPVAAKTSSAQVILSTSKASVDESSHESTTSAAVEGKEVESDH